MPIFYITIACVHIASCALPAPRFAYFEAENREMCEQNVRWIAARDGLRDFVVTCSDRGA
jgi:hypothetical protein